MCEEYDKQEKTYDGQLKWGEWMSQLELPSVRNEGDEKRVYCPPVFSSYMTYKEDVKLPEIDEKKQEKKY